MTKRLISDKNSLKIVDLSYETVDNKKNPINRIKIFPVHNTKAMG